MSQWKPRSKKHRAGPANTRKTAAQQRLAVRDPSGKVHLVLQRDPATGTDHVALQAPLFQEQWQNELALSAANVSYEALREGVDLPRTVALARQAMDATSQLADGLLSRAANGTVACKAGCDHCCHQSVGVTTAEALAILDHLQQTLSPEQLTARTKRATTAHERTRGLSAQERYSPEHPCPFLDAGHCSIYEVRPLSCRGMNSLDAAECEDNLRDPQSRAQFVARGGGGRAFMEPIRAFHAISAGLQLSLSELYHLDMRPLDLTAAIAALLTGNKSSIEQWLTGGSPFEAARGGDSSTSNQAHDLSGAIVTNLNNPPRR
jgi:Fe-S-cluster containining protein